MSAAQMKDVSDDRHPAKCPLSPRPGAVSELQGVSVCHGYTLEGRDHCFCIVLLGPSSVPSGGGGVLIGNWSLGILWRLFSH